MAVPEQVRRQSELIASLYEEMQGKEDTTPVGVADTTPEPVEPPAPPPPPPAQNSELERRYNALQAAYTADTGSLQSQLVEMTKRVGQLELLIGTQNDTTPRPPAQPASSLTDQEREEYGESIEIMRKVSQEAAQPYLDKIARLEATIAAIQPAQAQLKQTVDDVASSVTQTRADKFWTDLTAKAPNWRTVNDDPRFHEWLLQVDPLTGISRQTYLDEAQNRLDADRVSNFFTQWSGNTTNVQTSQNKDRRTKELEDQVAPGPGKTKIAGQVEGKKVYTTQDVRDFYADVRNGKYRGKESEKASKEADIFLAQSEGRLTN